MEVVRSGGGGSRDWCSLPPTAERRVLGESKRWPAGKGEGGVALVVTAQSTYCSVVAEPSDIVSDCDVGVDQRRQVRRDRELAIRSWALSVPESVVEYPPL